MLNNWRILLPLVPRTVWALEKDGKHGKRRVHHWSMALWHVRLIDDMSVSMNHTRMTKLNWPDAQDKCRLWISVTPKLCCIYQVWLKVCFAELWGKKVKTVMKSIVRLLLRTCNKLELTGSKWKVMVPKVTASGNWKTISDLNEDSTSEMLSDSSRLDAQTIVRFPNDRK